MIKPLKSRDRITQKFGLTHFNAKNKSSLFGRTLPISNHNASMNTQES